MCIASQVLQYDYNSIYSPSQQIVPGRNERRCRAAITTQPGMAYTVSVAAVPAYQGQHLMSNELSVSLPLDCSEIVLPPPHLRSANPDIYREYLEIRDGSTDLSTASKCDISTLYTEDNVSVG